MSRMLNVSGTVLPLSEDRVDLIGHGKERDYVGQCEVSENIRDIEYISYDRPIQVEPEIVQRVREADLIILSPGSLYTSVIPHLIAPAVREALEATKAPIMYISNLVTQPGETDEYTVADHVRVLDRYMDDRKVDVVIANTGVALLAVTEVYWDKEQKYGYSRIVENVGYWRKANAIHLWFVVNVQDGEDDCCYHREVTKEDLEELRDICHEVLCNPDVADDVLPTTAGFFFGSTDYDEWYMEDLRNTMDIIEEVLKTTDFDKEMIYYVSSW
jgi:uncharacterized cofD-like protein